MLGAIPDSSLCVFNRVTSSSINTIGSFREMMTINVDDTVSWNHRTNLIETMQAAGYHVAWISNQSARGIMDDGIACFAYLCDTAIWNGSKFEGDARLYHNTRDEELIPLAEAYHPESKQNMIVIHLMGSHSDYKKRYPKSFAKFSARDYALRPKNQQQILAHYDNSIFYNDYVVSELMKIYAEQDAVVFYLSDHAQDVFESDPNHCAHAKPNDPVSEFFGKQIPFMIYTSAKFRQNHSDLTARIRQAKDKPFATTNLTYMLMPFAGVRFEEFPNENPL
jgi:heptose-I-phosphate ethanolaminephosphotransferase